MEFLDYEKREDTYQIEYVIKRFAEGAIKDGESVTLKGTIHRI